MKLREENVKAIRSFRSSDARGQGLPQLRINQMERGTFVLSQDKQAIEDGVEITQGAAYELAQWLLHCVKS